MSLRTGELFAGVGGLGMAVDDVFGAEPAWFAEFDAAPSKVLARRYPGVPNHGDVTKVDWANVEPVNILCGGFPCQDVSLAGRRRGMKDGTRSGLWSEFARAIDIIRPDWVVIENVRGLLSADAAGSVEPCPWCLGDDGEQPALRALGAVLGDLAELGFDAEWTGLRAADIGAPHGRFRIFILAWPASNADRLGRNGRAEGSRRGEVRAAVAGDRPASTGLSLLPTPTIQDVAENLFPTPRATRGGSNTEIAYGLGGTRHDDTRTQGQVVPGTYWGPYEDAVVRWASVIGREAPSPVRNDGKGGKPRLSPALPEWIMGWPKGWVTDPVIGLTRAEQLKACGNGVVPQQAAYALRELLSRPGVPSLTAVRS